MQALLPRDLVNDNNYNGEIVGWVGWRTFISNRAHKGLPPAFVDDVEILAARVCGVRVKCCMCCQFVGEWVASGWTVFVCVCVCVCVCRRARVDML
jgi:hypothetical protein